MREVIKPALSLFVITFVAVLILAVANNMTKDIIARNELGEAADSMMVVLPIAESYDAVIETGDDSGVTSYATGYAGEEVCGYAVFVSVNGYGGEISMLVGIDSDGIIQGIDLLTHSETKGLGAKADEPEFKDQFIGLSGTLELNQDVDAITAATISSTAVTDGVNLATEYYESNLKGGAQ